MHALIQFLHIDLSLTDHFISKKLKYCFFKLVSQTHYSRIEVHFMLVCSECLKTSDGSTKYQSMDIMCAWNENEYSTPLTLINFWKGLQISNDEIRSRILQHFPRSCLNRGPDLFSTWKNYGILTANHDPLYVYLYPINTCNTFSVVPS